MNCPHCGRELPEGAHYCLHCMKSLQPEADYQPFPSPGRRKRGGVLAAVLLAAAACTAGIACAVHPVAVADTAADSSRASRGTPGQYQEADTGGYYFTPDGDAGDPDADAAEFEVEDGMLVRYNGSDATVRVPAGVTAIGQAAFMGNETVAEVILPDTLESIYSLAFSGCTALSRIEIPASVSRIDSEAFGRCTSLEGHLVDPESPYYTVEDGILFTADRSALCDYPAGKEGASYAIPDNVTMVMYWAFQGNPYLETVSVPAGITELFCTFGYCPSLREITVDPANPAYKSEDGILYTKDGSTLLCYPASKEGESFTIPEGVTALEGNAFLQAKNLRSVTIPEGVEQLPTFLFKEVERLEEVHLPSTITLIDSMVLYGALQNPVFYTPENQAVTDFCQANGIPCIVEGTE